MVNNNNNDDDDRADDDPDDDDVDEPNAEFSDSSIDVMPPRKRRCRVISQLED